MVVALLQIVPFQLGKEDGHQLLLLLDLEAPEFQLDVFQVRHQNNQELQSRIHREFSEHDRRRIESEAHLDIMNTKLFKVNFLLNLNFSTGLIIWLFESIKSLLDLVNIIDVLVIKLLLLVFVLDLVLLRLLNNVRTVPEHLIAKVSIEVEVERYHPEYEISEEVEVFNGFVLHILNLQMEEVFVHQS